MAVVTFELTPERLKWLGEHLDTPREVQPLVREEVEPGRVWELTERDGFIEDWLRIRTKTTSGALLQLNPMQRMYSSSCTKRNVVLKARQVGITTYIAARFFTQTITQGGILSMQVTQSRESAEDIFRIVRRFWENLPEELRKGYLRTSHRNARQLVFPNIDSEYCLASAEENAGRGRTIQNLHCSEVSRWGRQGDEALASLRSALVPTGEIVLESTANGAGGLFYEEWQRAEDTGYQRHFFPWWVDPAYAIELGANFPPLTVIEQELAGRHGLKPEQIAWRRKQWGIVARTCGAGICRGPGVLFPGAEEVGYVGAGIAAAYVKNPADVRDDANYVRRVTFNVGRVALVTATSLLLTQALPGGIPATGASVQKVIAFVDREGGSFLQQWSGLFVAEEESGGRVCFFYPILSPCTPKAEWARESLIEIQKPIGQLALQASFAALPTLDGNDGAVVLSYRSYFPASGAAVY